LRSSRLAESNGETYVGTLGPRWNVGGVALDRVAKPFPARRHLGGVRLTDRRGSAHVADSAVVVGTGLLVATALVLCGFIARALPMLRIKMVVLVVPEMALRGRVAFMLTIAGHRSPGHLERKPNQQEQAKQSTHGAASIG